MLFPSNCEVWGQPYIVCSVKFTAQILVLALLFGCSDPEHDLSGTELTGLGTLQGPAFRVVQKCWTQVQITPKSPSAWRDLTFATHANDLLEAALYAHQKLAELEGTTADDFRMAVVLERLGRQTESLALLTGLEDPTGTSLRRIARIQLDEGLLEEAIVNANQARSLNRQDLGHLTVWCEIQLQRNEGQAVREVLRDVLPSLKVPSWLHTLDARAAEILGDPAPPYASTPADRVVYLPNVHLDPLLPWVRTREGDVERLRATIKSGDSQEALAMSARLVLERPEDPEIAAVHAGLLREAGRNSEAIRVLDQHRALLPSGATFWKNDAMSRIFAFAEGGPNASSMLAMARESADRATTYGAGDLQCWKVSGIVAGQEQNHIRAEEDYRKAASLARGDTQILLTLDAEMSRGRSGDWASAVEALLPLERQYGMTVDGPLGDPVRRATIEALARAGFLQDAKDRVAALSRAGRSEAGALARLVQGIEAARSGNPSR